MEKRVALQLFGHIRTYETCYPFLKKNLLDLCHVDIFFHTWNESERKTKSWRDTEIESVKITNSAKEKILRLYRPVSYLFDDQVGKFD